MDENKIREFCDIPNGTKITVEEFDLLLGNNGSDESKYDYALNYNTKEGWCIWCTEYKNIRKNNNMNWVAIPKAAQKRGTLKFE